MSVVDRLLGRAGSPAKSTAPPTSPGRIGVPYLDQRSAIALSAVWRCVTLISDAISDMPWTEWRETTQILPPSRLVRRPLVTMTRREWTWRVTATEALWNTCHLLHVGGSDAEGKPWSLLPLPPAAIAPASSSDPWGILPPSRYLVMGTEIDASHVTVLRRAPWPGVPDWMNGILDIARTQFTSYLAADMHAARYWMAGGPTVTQIVTDQEIDDDTAEDIGSRWLAMRSRGSDFPAVLGWGAEAKAWGADPTAESAVEARKEINADVGRYFGVPTRILNAPAGDTETYSNVESDEINLYRHCLRGYAGPIEDGISELLAGDLVTGRRMELDPTRLLQGDLASRAIAYPALVAAGIFTEDEARLRGFGLPPKAGPSGGSVSQVQVQAADMADVT